MSTLCSEEMLEMLNTCRVALGPATGFFLRRVCSTYLLNLSFEEALEQAESSDNDFLACAKVGILVCQVVVKFQDLLQFYALLT